MKTTAFCLAIGVLRISILCFNHFILLNIFIFNLKWILITLSFVLLINFFLQSFALKSLLLQITVHDRSKDQIQADKCTDEHNEDEKDRCYSWPTCVLVIVHQMSPAL